MDELTLLKPKLVRLKLSGMLETLSARVQQAMDERWSYSNFLDILLADEVDRRDHKQLTRRLLKSTLEPGKTLESFDFSFNPRLHEPTIRELASCRFLGECENVLLVGPSGVGKSHLAQALGHQAARRGRDVMFRRAAALLHWIGAGDGDGSHERRLRSACSVDLLILDDFGLTALRDEQQNDLYELICERYERRSTILTSNRDFSEWPLVFANPLMASAAMDRLLHRAVKLELEGKSYRVNAFHKRSKELTKASNEI